MHAPGNFHATVAKIHPLKNHHNVRRERGRGLLRLRRRRGLLPGEKLRTGEGIFRTTAGVPFYEVIEVSLEGLE